MNDLTKEDLLESLNELEQLVQSKTARLTSTPNGFEDKLSELENKIQLLNEKHQRAYAILEKVTDELEQLLMIEDIKCQL